MERSLSALESEPDESSVSLDVAESDSDRQAVRPFRRRRDSCSGLLERSCRGRWRFSLAPPSLSQS